MRLDGEVSSPIDPPAHVCRFHGRCPRGEDRCTREAPPLVMLSGDARGRVPLRGMSMPGAPEDQ